MCVLAWPSFSFDYNAPIDGKVLTSEEWLEESYKQLAKFKIIPLGTEDKYENTKKFIEWYYEEWKKMTSLT